MGNDKVFLWLESFQQFGWLRKSACRAAPNKNSVACCNHSCSGQLCSGYPGVGRHACMGRTCAGGCFLKSPVTGGRNDPRRSRAKQKRHSERGQVACSLAWGVRMHGGGWASARRLRGVTLLCTSARICAVESCHENTTVRFVQNSTSLFRMWEDRTD